MSQNTNVERKQGIVTETLPNTMFKVELEDGREILAYLAGKMRIHRIRILIGDKVDVEMPPGEDRGRIVYRYK